jgi:hypothetical protein
MMSNFNDAFNKINDKINEADEAADATDATAAPDGGVAPETPPATTETPGGDDDGGAEEKKAPADSGTAPVTPDTPEGEAATAEEVATDGGDAVEDAAGEGKEKEGKGEDEEEEEPATSESKAKAKVKAKANEGDESTGPKPGGMLDTLRKRQAKGEGIVANPDDGDPATREGIEPDHWKDSEETQIRKLEEFFSATPSQFAAIKLNEQHNLIIEGDNGVMILLKTDGTWAGVTEEAPKEE